LRLNSIQLHHDNTIIDHHTCSLAALAQANFVKITFDNQKNRIKGEIIAHRSSSDPIACPIAALVRRISHLRLHHAPPDTPLYAYHVETRWETVTSPILTATLRRSAAYLGPALGLRPSDISSRSLRAGGAMALLCAQVDPDLIKMVGRWRSDAMFRYLHLQATPLIGDLSHRMLTGGNFTLLPDADVPAPAAALLLQVPLPVPTAP
jgi:hypothetical protein